MLKVVLRFEPELKLLHNLIKQSTVKTVGIGYLRQPRNLRILSQRLLRRINVCPTRYKIGPPDVLDLVNWYSQFC